MNADTKIKALTAPRAALLRVRHVHTPVGGLVPATLILTGLAVATATPLALWLAVASTWLLGLACAAVLLVQGLQPRFNRTPMLPGVALVVCAWYLAHLLGSGQPLLVTLLLGAVLPLLGLAMAGIAVLELLRWRAPGLRTVGFATLYRCDAKRMAAVIPRPVAQSAPSGPSGALPLPPPASGGTDTTSRQVHDEDADLKRHTVARPRRTFASLFGNDALKARLLEASRAWREEGKNGVLLFGPAGTGKTAFAEALAGELGIGFQTVTFGSAASRFVNQTTEQLTVAFADARRAAPVLLFIDEADALLATRTGEASRYEEYHRTVDALLAEIVRLRGTGVLLVAATNYIERLDEAAVREGRFDFKIEVSLPDAPARQGLIDQQLRAFACTADTATEARLVKRWAGFNVPRVLRATEAACKLARQESGANTGLIPVSYDHFYRGLRSVQGRQGGAPEGAKALADLFMSSEQASALRSLANRLAHVDEVERLGGSLPRGVLFYGAPGTGKTAAASALARECGWSFLPRTGRELMAPGAVAELGKAASDLRPAIVFIDEADDVLADREGSPYRAATNELLALIDGASGMLQDVVWIAATNHPEAMDPAALRGGRFGTKVEFTLPSAATLLALVTQWAARKVADGGLVVQGTPEVWAAQVCPLLSGRAPADVYNVLDAANNLAITRHLDAGGGLEVTAEVVRQALAANG